MSKAVLNSRIKEMKCNGKAIPQEYIVCFNDYIKNIIGTRVDQEIASLNKIIVEKFEIGKFKSVNELIYSYKNLEKEFTKSRQKIAELEQELTELKEKAIVPKFKIGQEVYSVFINRKYMELNEVCNLEITVIMQCSKGIYYQGYILESGKNRSAYWFDEKNTFLTEQEAQTKLQELRGGE